MEPSDEPPWKKLRMDMETVSYPMVPPGIEVTKNPLNLEHEDFQSIFNGPQGYQVRRILQGFPANTADLLVKILHLLDVYTSVNHSWVWNWMAVIMGGEINVKNYGVTKLKILWTNVFRKFLKLEKDFISMTNLGQRVHDAVKASTPPEATVKFPFQYEHSLTTWQKMDIFCKIVTAVGSKVGPLSLNKVWDVYKSCHASNWGPHLKFMQSKLKVSSGDMEKMVRYFAQQHKKSLVIIGKAVVLTKSGRRQLSSKEAKEGAKKSTLAETDKTKTSSVESDKSTTAPLGSLPHSSGGMELHANTSTISFRNAMQSATSAASLLPLPLRVEKPGNDSNITQAVESSISLLPFPSPYVQIPPNIAAATGYPFVNFPGAVTGSMVAQAVPNQDPGPRQTVMYSSAEEDIPAAVEWGVPAEMHPQAPGAEVGHPLKQVKGAYFDFDAPESSDADMGANTFMAAKNVKDCPGEAELEGMTAGIIATLQNDHISVTKVQKLLLERNKVDKLQDLGIQSIRAFRCVRMLERKQNYVNEIILSYFAANPIVTYHDLASYVREVCDIKVFRQLGLGPFSAQPMVKSYFKDPGRFEGRKLRAVDIYMELHDYLQLQYLIEQEACSVTMEEFEMHLKKVYEVRNVDYLGVYIQDIIKAQRSIRETVSEMKADCYGYSARLKDGLKNDIRQAFLKLRNSLFIGRKSLEPMESLWYADAGASVKEIFRKVEQFYSSLDVHGFAELSSNRKGRQGGKRRRNKECPTQEIQAFLKLLETDPVFGEIFHLCICMGKREFEERVIQRLTGHVGSDDGGTSKKAAANEADDDKPSSSTGPTLEEPQQCHCQNVHDLDHILDIADQCFEAVDQVSNKFKALESVLVSHFYEYGLRSIEGLGLGSSESLMEKSSERSPGDGKKTPRPPCVLYEAAMCCKSRFVDYKSCMSDLDQGILGEQTVDKAITCIRNCPTLENLYDWTNWCLVFEPQFGDLKTFIKTKIIGMTMLETKPGTLLKLPSESSLEKLTEAAQREDVTETCGELIGVFVEDWTFGQASSCTLKLANAMVSALQNGVSVQAGIDGKATVKESDRGMARFILGCLTKLPLLMCEFLTEDVLVHSLSTVAGVSISEARKLIMSVASRTEEKNRLCQLGVILHHDDWTKIYQKRLEQVQEKEALEEGEIEDSSSDISLLSKKNAGQILSPELDNKTESLCSYVTMEDDQASIRSYSSRHKTQDDQASTGTYLSRVRTEDDHGSVGTYSSHVERQDDQASIGSYSSRHKTQDDQASTGTYLSRARTEDDHGSVGTSTYSSHVKREDDQASIDTCISAGRVKMEIDEASICSYSSRVKTEHDQAFTESYSCRVKTEQDEASAGCSGTTASTDRTDASGDVDIEKIFRKDSWKEESTHSLIMATVALMKKWRNCNRIDFDTAKNNIYLLTNHGFKNPSKTTVHFGQDYGCRLDFEKIFPGVEWNILDGRYMEEYMPTNSTRGWKDFFRELGVADGLAIKGTKVEITREELETGPLAGCMPALVTEEKLTNKHFDVLSIKDVSCDDIVTLQANASEEKLYEHMKNLYKIISGDYGLLVQHMLVKLQSKGMRKECDINVETTLGRYLKQLDWVPAQRTTFESFLSEGALVCKEEDVCLQAEKVYIRGPLIEKVLAHTVPYLDSELDSTLAFELGAKVSLSYQDVLEHFVSWCCPDTEARAKFVTSIQHMKEVYSYMKENLPEDKLEAFSELPCVFIPDQVWDREHLNVSGRFYHIHEVCCRDPQFIISKYMSNSLQCLRPLEPHYDDFASFFADLGSMEAMPRLKDYLIIIDAMIKSANVVKEDIFVIFSIVGEQLSQLQEEELGHVNSMLKKYLQKKKLFPTISGEFVSLDVGPYACYEELSENMKKAIEGIGNVHWIKVEKIQDMEDPASAFENTKTFLTACGIHDIQEMITTNVDATNKVIYLDLRLSLLWMAEMIVSFLKSRYTWVYNALEEMKVMVDLKLSSFYRVSSLSVVHSLKDKPEKCYTEKRGFYYSENPSRFYICRTDPNAMTEMNKFLAEFFSLRQEKVAVDIRLFVDDVLPLLTEVRAKSQERLQKMREQSPTPSTSEGSTPNTEPTTLLPLPSHLMNQWTTKPSTPPPRNYVPENPTVASITNWVSEIASQSKGKDNSLIGKIASSVWSSEMNERQSSTPTEGVSGSIEESSSSENKEGDEQPKPDDTFLQAQKNIAMLFSGKWPLKSDKS